MNHLQHPVLLILAGTVALVAYGRWRSDLVAVLALIATVLSGIVQPERAFEGFANPVIAIVALLSIISVTIRNSVLVETLVNALNPVMRWQTVRIGVLGVIGAVLSAGLGSGAVLSSITVATVQGMRRDRQQIVPILLPVSLLAILGGLVSSIGTLPNLLVAGLRPGDFTLFAFAHAGLPVALAGLVVILIAWRFLPRHETEEPAHSLPQIESYTSEVSVPPGSPLIGQTIGMIELRSEGAVTLKGIVRESFRRIDPRADWTVEPHDVLVLACEPIVLQRLMERAGLQIVGGAEGVPNSDRIGVVEAIVTPGSELVGRSPDESNLRARAVSLLAIGRSGRQPAGRLHRTKLQPGDVLLLQGELAAMPGTLAGMGCLTLAERRLRLGQRRRVFTPVAVLTAALVLTINGTLPLVMALLITALVLVLLRAVTLDEAYAAIPWPVLVMLGALLPISNALQNSEAAAAVVHLLSPALAVMPGPTIVFAVLALSLAATPFLGGPVTILALYPFLLAIATQRGLQPHPLLVAAALGASCEFLSRAASLLPGAERNVAAWRLLLPLYLVVLAVGGGAILLHWPLG